MWLLLHSKLQAASPLCPATSQLCPCRLPAQLAPHPPCPSTAPHPQVLRTAAHYSWWAILSNWRCLTHRSDDLFQSLLSGILKRRVGKIFIFPLAFSSPAATPQELRRGILGTAGWALSFWIPHVAQRWGPFVPTDGTDTTTAGWDGACMACRRALPGAQSAGSCRGQQHSTSAAHHPCHHSLCECQHTTAWMFLSSWAFFLNSCCFSFFSALCDGCEIESWDNLAWRGPTRIIKCKTQLMQSYLKFKPHIWEVTGWKQALLDISWGCELAQRLTNLDSPKGRGANTLSKRPTVQKKWRQWFKPMGLLMVM